MNANIQLIIQGREKDLGGFFVRRILPYATHRMVGPFIFFDHMGPAELMPGQAMDVRPHPHIGLATVTYLFEGSILHRDSLGSVQLIEPGAINWMTAGRGIVHSERTPKELRSRPLRMNGIQCWVALPIEHEETNPNFSHHPSETLPESKIGDVSLKLLLGEAFGKKSPVTVHSNLFYLEVKMPAGTFFELPQESRERAIYLVDGEVTLDDEVMSPFTMAVTTPKTDSIIVAQKASRLMLLGGESVGERFIWWNLVASSEDKIARTKAEWAHGPMKEHTRFHPVPGDDQEFIPLPSEPVKNPKGSVL